VRVSGEIDGEIIVIGQHFRFSVLGIDSRKKLKTDIPYWKMRRDLRRPLFVAHKSRLIYFKQVIHENLNSRVFSDPTTDATMRTVAVSGSESVSIPETIAKTTTMKA
jgi:hypothetical protein